MEKDVETKLVKIKTYKNNYIEEITFSVPITDYLLKDLNKNIKRTLEVLDAYVSDEKERKKIRRAILSGYNDFYLTVCKVITNIQDADKST